MAVRYTYHGRVRPQEYTGTRIDVLGPQVGNSVAVADSAASTAIAADFDGYYRIAATTNSLVNISSSVTDGSNGEYWPAGQVEVRILAAGQKIGVSAG